MEAESTSEFKRLKEAYEILTGKRPRPPECSCPYSYASGHTSSEAKSRTWREPAERYDGANGFGADTHFSQPIREDVFSAITIPLEMAFAGGKVPIPVHVDQACGACNGKGIFRSLFTLCPTCGGSGRQVPFGRWGSSTCSACDGNGREKSRCWWCHGSGVTHASKNIEVFIPPRTGPGVVLRVKGAGHVGMGSVAHGDVVVTVLIEWPHPHYQWMGLTIEGPAGVDCVAAILGGPTEAIVLGSKVAVEIPPDVHAGMVITVPKEGLKDTFGHVGDLRLHVVLDVLNSVDEHTREKLRVVLSAAGQRSL
ncbi:DnaJ C-terminal domain-containing protein [Paraburkholderia sediminicola]